MVRRIGAAIVVAVGVAMASPAAAQTAAWDKAGGGLFAGPETPRTDEAAIDVVDAPAWMTPASQPFEVDIQEAAERHGLDPKLLHALVLAESGYRPAVCSAAGACGLTQLMPATARELGVADRFDARENLRGGADYLTRQLVRFGDVKLALAAYNSGPNRVARLGRVPDIAETQDYVARVVACFLALTAGRTVASANDCEAETRP